MAYSFFFSILVVVILFSNICRVASSDEHRAKLGPLNVFKQDLKSQRSIGVIEKILLLQKKILATLIKAKECKNEEKAKDCSELYKKGKRKSGIYKIDPDNRGSFNVWCDMKTSDGGWTVFQRRLDGSVDFYRGWQDYKNGFGNLKSEFWLGLDKISRLTSRTQNKLRIDMEDTKGNKKYAEYDFFSVTSEKQKYKLGLGKYSGTAGDSFSSHKGMAFSTKDSDNDKSSGNCAIVFKGAWWYESCHASNLNGIYHHGKHSSYADGINWHAWKGHHYSLKSTSMKIRSRNFLLKK
ncbi:ryncolin-1-like [Xenia sp. Carnegie-2017]|uniref:ryncolin-1-like n=1 Tax=Xenia sp. Carnegie-2017 TaxID=2897299 RepID=UPI001F04521D|nr:ryncolin-1-like [Xenia sp. Carnegie-2017]